MVGRGRRGNRSRKRKGEWKMNAMNERKRKRKRRNSSRKRKGEWKTKTVNDRSRKRKGK